MTGGASTPIELRDLLRARDIDPSTVLVLRHRPFEPELFKVLPWLAAEHPATFNAYQQTQSLRVEKAMQRAEYVASFIGHDPGRALFVGIYRRGGWAPLTYENYWKISAYVEMKKFGIRGFQGGRESILWFELTLLDYLSVWKGRLIVDWPRPDRAWWRWADKNHMLIHAIHEESILVAQIPSWDEMTLTLDQLRLLPSTWKAALKQWRGVYYIFDESDGQGYVGSAHGSNNILGRWRHYANSGHGGNEELRRRNPKGFRFSILQRTSPDMTADEILRLETTWKIRLHTREHGMNKNY